MIFNLLFAFIIFPLTVILFLIWLGSGKLYFRDLLKVIWLGIFGLSLLSYLLKWLNSKTELDKEDYYGEYVINRDYFKGEQTDWQYNHFRFEITDEDSLFFHFTDKDKIINTYRGTISTTKPYNSARLIINMEQPTHHIMIQNPTTYRSSWSFYLVFKSGKFYNVFFKKGKWKPII